MKLSDYLAQFLSDHQIRDIFLVSGGGIMHLLDAVGGHLDLRYYCNYHEQACAGAAEAYTRVTGRIGACLVTTGPGGTNALSAVASAWVDSIPMLVLSGQVRREVMANYDVIRQKGPQEGNVVAMAAPVTKYAVTLLDPSRVRFELEKALHLATTGRPGPVWLDIPLDVQAAEVDAETLEGFDPEPIPTLASLSNDVAQVLDALAHAERPLLLAGNGVHIGHAEALFLEFLETVQVPVVLPHVGKDLVPENHPSFMGVFGPTGQRRANFALQNADCLLSLASGLNIAKTGFQTAGFAPKARKLFVDIDPGQLSAQPITPDLAVQADIQAFLQEALHQIRSTSRTFPEHAAWKEACARWKQRYPVMVESCFTDADHVNGYAFADRLSDLLTDRDLIVAGNGIDAVSLWQAFKVRRGQRLLISGNWGPMGWDLPAAVGACIGGARRTICVTGDGSLQWNVQELLTIRHYRLPVKLFVFNNHGYTNIRSTQSAFFGRFVGADESSGVSNPDFVHLAAAYGLPYFRIRNHSEMEDLLPAILKEEGPAFCEVNIAVDQGISPKATAFRKPDGTLESRPLEDMFPFLPREEILENMTLFDSPKPSAIQS